MVIVEAMSKGLPVVELRLPARPERDRRRRPRRRPRAAGGRRRARRGAPRAHARPRAGARATPPPRSRRRGAYEVDVVGRGWDALLDDLAVPPARFQGVNRGPRDTTTTSVREPVAADAARARAAPRRPWRPRSCSPPRPTRTATPRPRCWRGRTRRSLGRLAAQVASVGAAASTSSPGPQWVDAVERALGGAVAVHAPRAGPSDDLPPTSRADRRLARAAAAAARRAGRGPHPARGARRPRRRPARARPASSRRSGASGGRSRQRMRTARGRVVSAASPYHARQPAHGDLPRRRSRSPTPTAPRSSPPPSASPRSSTGGAAGGLGGRARPQDRHLARRRSPAPRWRQEMDAERPRRRPTFDDEDGAAGARAAGGPAPTSSSPTRTRRRSRAAPASPPTTSRRCSSPGSCARAPRSASATCASSSGRARSRRADVERAATDIQEYDEDKVLLDSAVKAADGFFTTFFVSPYSKYIARWCARRGSDAEPGHDGLGADRRPRRARRSRPASAGASSPARSCSRSRSRPTASTASSPATRGSSRSSAPGWTPSSTARRSTSSSPAWRSATRRRTRDDVWVLAGAALTLQTSAT